LRVKAVVTLVILAIVVAGCGGGGKTPAKEEKPAETKETTTAVAVEGRLPVPRELKADKDTPRFLKEAIESNEPFLVLFYMQEDYISDKVRQELRDVLQDPQFAGKVNVILLDTEDSEKTSKAAEIFKVSLLPHLAIVDSKGVVMAEFRGYVDSDVIKQSLYNVLYR
jgi:hypothetical protein